MLPVSAYLPRFAEYILIPGNMEGYFISYLSKISYDILYGGRYRPQKQKMVVSTQGAAAERHRYGKIKYLILFCLPRNIGFFLTVSDNEYVEPIPLFVPAGPLQFLYGPFRH